MIAIYSVNHVRLKLLKRNQSFQSTFRAEKCKLHVHMQQIEIGSKLLKLDANANISAIAEICCGSRRQNANRKYNYICSKLLKQM